MAKLNVISVCFCLVIVTAQPALAQNWPQWRGPLRDGAVADFIAPSVWPEKLKLRWKVSVGSGVSSPVADAGKVWIHSRKGDDEVVSCLDLKTGKPLWSKSYPAPFAGYSAAARVGKGPYSTPVLFGGRLYTLGITAILSCFDAQTGELIWRRDFGPVDISNMFTGTGMSPVIDRDSVIVHVGDDRGGKLLALDAANGKEKWQWSGDGPGYASPIAVEFEGERQLVTMTDKAAIGVAAQSGQLLWRIPWPDKFNENIVTPVSYKDMLIFSGVRKGTLAVRVKKQGHQWTTQEVWSNPDVCMYMSSPILDGDHLFGMSDKRKGQFFCLDAATGKVAWATEGREGSNAAIVSAKGVLFILTDEAKLIVAKKSASGFETIKTYLVADSQTLAHPVVSGRQIIIKDSEGLALWSLE
jgi:outer membrane protein assembly factor BamB